MEESNGIGGAELENDSQAAIDQQILQVRETLDLLFNAANNNEDIWLKKKNARALATWIVNLQNIATLLEGQVEALKEEVANNPKSKIWTPGLQ